MTDNHVGEVIYALCSGWWAKRPAVTTHVENEAYHVLLFVCALSLALYCVSVVCALSCVIFRVGPSWGWNGPRRMVLGFTFALGCERFALADINAPTPLFADL